MNQGKFNIKSIFLKLCPLILLVACSQAQSTSDVDATHEKNTTTIIEKDSEVVDNEQVIDNKIHFDGSQTSIGKIPLPKGYTRIAADEKSFISYLRNLPLKTDDDIVNYYDGSPIDFQVGHYAILDMDIGKTNLQHCADAVMRFRAEYLYSQKRYDEIQFSFASGDLGRFEQYAKGYRGSVKGNRFYWKQTASRTPDYSEKNFKKYMNLIYAFAGTVSLPRDVKSITLDDIQVGDIFLETQQPFGHVVTVADMAIDDKTGEKIFLVVQGFLPAQEFHVLQNFNNDQLTPWYSLEKGETLHLPSWTFTEKHLKRFKN